MSALITNKNSPNVMTVMGKVSMSKMGLMKVLSKASTNASNNAVVNCGMCTPLKTVDKPYATSAVIKRRIMMFMLM